VQRLWRHLAEQTLLMFVSPAAVDWFFRLRPASARWPAQTLAAAPGPGTAQALLQSGAACDLRGEHIIQPAATADQYDSEALWPLLATLPWQGRNVSIIGGGDQGEVKGRAWLTAQWQACGARVTTWQAYERGPSDWLEHEKTLARQALTDPEQHLWLFSSSQAIDFLLDHHVPALGLADPPDWSRAHALATHPRIAERARRAGFGHVQQTRPTVEAVVQARRSPA
jgi:uroporphyrinogen-III synthase